MLEKNIDVNNTGLIGELVVIINIENRKIAAKLINETPEFLLVENSVHFRTLIPKDEVLLIRRPHISNCPPAPNYYKNGDGGDDPDERISDNETL